MSFLPEVHPAVVSAMLEHGRRLRPRTSSAAQLVLNRALRDRADGIREVLAAGALVGGTWSSVSEYVKEASPREVAELESDAAPWWRALGRITLLHAETVEDEALASSFFAIAGQLDGHRSLSLGEHLSILQAAWDTRELDVFGAIPAGASSLPDIEHQFIELDLIAVKHGAGSHQWLDQLNGRIFSPQGLAPLHLSTQGRTLYDRITSEAPEAAVDSPLITVVMTTFKRHQEILTSVHSILRQTWKNLELLIVDDASGSEFEPLLEELEQLDVRIRVIRQVENSGTYLCRNRAMSDARGEYITFQDDDDWSHPQRLERQVAPMLEDRRIHSTLSHCVRTTEDLHFRYAAVTSSRMNSSSLMFRRRDLSILGGFDSVRKGGDSEFIRRLCEAIPGRQEVIKEILALVRLTQGSLSRTDFGAGWNHPSRSEYWEAAQWWHRSIRLGASPVIATFESGRTFPAPRRFQGAGRVDSMPSEFDVVLVGDFAADVPWASLAWNRLQFALEKYDSVGIIHLNSPARPTGRPPRIAASVRALIHAGRVERLLPTDDVRIGRMIICDAAVLEFQDLTRWEATCGTAVLYADTSPAEYGEPSFWSTRDVLGALHAMFDPDDVAWVAADHGVRSSLEQSGATLLTKDIPYSMCTDAIFVAKRYPATVPVIGRCSPHLAVGWPGDKVLFDRVYPDSADIDVRIYGDTRALREAGRGVPRHWLWFQPHDFAFSTFVQSLDFYVYSGDKAPSTTELRVMLSVIAAGRVVIIDEKFEHVLGGAAVSSSVDDLRSTMMSLQRNTALYEAQVVRARRLLKERLVGAAPLV